MDVMNLPTLEIGALGCTLPIIQGGMAVRISLAPLAAAVANEGGVGLVAGSGMHPPELAEEIRKARSLTEGVVGVNIMVAAREFRQLVGAAIQEKVDLVVAGAGFSRDVFKWCAEARIPFVPIVSNDRVARLAEKFGAAAVIVEGKEAGGHLGTDQPMKSLLPRIVEAVKIPVIAAGGILNGCDIAEVLAMGARGVQMGTRFAASVESSAAEAFKKAYVAAKASDVILIESPVGMPGRALLSPLTRRLLAGDAPPPNTLSRCVACLKHCKKNYCIIDALVRAQEGDMVNGLVFCGERVSEIEDIPTVSEIVDKLVRQYRESIQLGVAQPCVGS